jgi:hypothetical protein
MSSLLLGGTLAVTLGATIGKFLLKHYLGELAAAVGGGLLDLGKHSLKDKIKDARAKAKAEREYAQIGDDVVKWIETDLQSAAMGMVEPRPDVNAVASRFESILSGKLAATFVIRNQIDPQKLTEALHTAVVPGAVPLTPAEQKLFDSTANQVALYLFRAASKLPQFDAAREEESVASLSQLSGEMSEVFEDVQQIHAHVVALPLTTELEFETNYRNAIVAELDKVELFGVDLPPELHEARLTDAYVTLRLRASEDEDEEPNIEGKGEDAPATLSAEEAFDKLRPRAGRLLIRGGAGCGKTTLVRWAAIQAARGTNPERRNRPEYEKTSDGEIRILHENE